MSLPATDVPGAARSELLSRRGRDATSSVIRDLLQLTHRPDILSMAGGLPAPESFPVDRLRAAADTVLSGSGRYGPEAIQYGPTEGVPALREWVAATVHGRWPGRAAAEDVLITTGSQQGLDLLARALVDPGDDVVVEAPVVRRRAAGAAGERTEARAGRRPTGTACGPTCSKRSWPPGCGPACATWWPTSRTPRAARWPSSGAATWPSWPIATAS